MCSLNCPAFESLHLPSMFNTEVFVAVGKRCERALVEQEKK